MLNYIYSALLCIYLQEFWSILDHLRNCKWYQLSTADIDSLKRLRNKTKYCYILHTMNCFLFGIYYFINIAYIHMNSEQFSELFHHAAHLFCHSVHLRIIGLRWNAIYGRLGTQALQLTQLCRFFPARSRHAWRVFGSVQSNVRA